MARVKICGVNSAAAFEAAAAAAADWVGFVFFAGSPRCMTPAGVKGIAPDQPGGPERVGLFVDPTDGEIEAALAATRLDVLQLYASEPRVAEIAVRVGRPVWRAVAVRGREDVPAGAGAAAALVIEPRAPEGAGRPGGLGQALDWTVLRGWSPGYDWLLAGGLTPGNVARAIALTGAPAVDVSSGVESQRGVKSSDLIRAFIRAAKE